jgi:hypothetical protein
MDHVTLICQGDPIGTPTTTFPVLVLLGAIPVLLGLCALGAGVCRQQTIEVIHMNETLRAEGRGGR